MTDLNVHSGEATLAGEVRGDGPALVFLHAGVADRRMWDGVVETVAGTHRTVAYDRRGFGGTPPHKEAYSHTNDLLAVLDAAGISHATLVGCSQGGKVALDFTLAHPERVSALVLVAPAVGGAPAVDTFPQDVEALLEDLEAAEESEDLDRLNLLEARVWLDGVLGAEGRVQGDLRDLFVEMNGVALQAAPQVGEETPPPPAWPRLGEIAVPTLLVWGDLDFPHAQERCQTMSELIPDARGRVMHGTAHLPSFEDPESFSTLLTDFLTEVEQTDRP
ncbi:alpha/beta hydrolase [Nocardioides KLBMP 9356]|uniref:Alpha/beta hydrolase n=1 Tax=Nocardioides potassii TaxID=2911371 RepID=A0ABS9HFN2_9ACTN|nr:alpha/beta fold hydrolase [Nocardioides potassii]MCF6379359.1 alpha/beta hydrolase [Nocardioides potassii]